MDDPGVRRHDREVVEAVLAPAQERVALLVALELALGVDPERVAGAEGVDLHGVVDDQLGGHERVDRRGVAAVVGDRVAHRGEVDHGGHAGEVLHHHARGGEGDLLGRVGGGVPARELLDALLGDRDPVLVAEQVLEQHLQRERQPRDVELGLERVEPEDLEGLAPDLEFRPRVEGVLRHALQNMPRPPLAQRGSVSEPPSKRTSTGSEPPAGTRQESVSGAAWPGLIVTILPIRARSNFEPFTCHDHG